MPTKDFDLMSLAGMQGIFAMRAYDINGSLLWVYEDHNLIVNSAKNILAKLLSDTGAQAKTVTQIGFGTSGTAPVSTDTALTGAYIKSIDNFTYPQVDRVTFNWSLGYGEGNGMTIQEYGLFAADNTLFARKTRGAIVKGSDLSLVGSWTIVF